MERESVLEPDATQAAVSPHPTKQSHTLGTVVLMSLIPEEASAYPRKEDPIMNRSCAEHRVARVLPERGARVSEGYIFFCCVDVSFLIYRIFNVKIALNSINVNAAFCSSYKKGSIFVVYCNNIFYIQLFK